MKATNPWSRRSTRLVETPGVCLAVLLVAVPAGGEPWKLRGDARYYQFARVDDPDRARRDAELGIFRLKLEGQFGDALAGEADGVASFTSPGSTVAASIASGTTRRYFGLRRAVIDEADGRLLMEVDRLNLSLERRGFRLVADSRL